jgi:hypothetical protein
MGCNMKVPLSEVCDVTIVTPSMWNHFLAIVKCDQLKQFRRNDGRRWKN